MRPKRALLALAFLAGCGAPEAFDFAPLHEAEHRFVPPVREDPKSRLGAILKKQELTLADALAVADLMNPSLAAERANVDLATAAIWEARLYPNPSIVLETEDYRTSGGIGSAERTAGLSVPVAVGGRIGAATAVAEKEREIAALRYVWKRREILTRVKRGFAVVLAARRTVELARETRDIARAFHDATDERFKAQAVPEMELLKAAVSRAKAETDLKLAERDAAVTVKELQALMGNADFPIDRFAGDLAESFPVPSFEALRGVATANHPLLEAAVKSREAAALELDLAYAERIPDVGLRVTGGLDPEGETIFEGGVEIPLPLFNRNQAKVAAAEARVRRAELLAQEVRNDLIVKLTEAYRSFTAARDRVEVYNREILPKARKALEQTTEGFRLGKFGYLDVLDAQRTLADAKVASAAALTDLNVSAIELELHTGSRLDSDR